MNRDVEIDKRLLTQYFEADCRTLYAETPLRAQRAMTIKVTEHISAQQGVITRICRLKFHDLHIEVVVVYIWLTAWIRLSASFSALSKLCARNGSAQHFSNGKGGGEVMRPKKAEKKMFYAGGRILFLDLIQNANLKKCSACMRGIPIEADFVRCKTEIV